MGASVGMAVERRWERLVEGTRGGLLCFRELNTMVVRHTDTAPSERIEWLQAGLAMAPCKIKSMRL